MPLEEDAVQAALANVLAEKVEGLDDDLISYLAGLLTEGLEDEVTAESVAELMEPFLESMACPLELMEQANQTIVELGSAATTSDNTTTQTSGGAQRLKQGIVSMSSHLTDQSETDVEANRYLWGTDTAAAMANTQIDAYSSKVSQKDKRKQRQELEQVRREFQAKLELEQQEENATQGVVSAMVLPDYRSGRNERDVQVRNVSISLDNGRSLLDDGELKFAHRRRYGLVGKNGVGKTTLLKAIAAMDIEGFPKHLRVLHVRQELKTNADDTAVLTAVLEADAERNALLARRAISFASPGTRRR